MISDAGLDRGAADRAFDVCVIGAGPAGITLARHLAASGASVALMEAGGRDFSVESQQLYRGENVGLDYFALDSARLRFFGGSSNHWGGWCRPLDPVDFVVKPHVPHSGWPIGKADLDPYTEATDAILDLAPHAEPPPSALPRPDKDFTRVQFRFSPPTRFRDKYWDELAASPRVHVLLNANLVDLRLSDDLGAVEAAVFRGYAAGDPGFTIRARAYALCTGGIENPRLLLNFTSQMPEGIGNRFDLVGRCFAEHPHVTVADVLLRDPLPAREFYAATEAFIFEERVQNSLINLDPLPPRPPPDLFAAAKRSTRCVAPFVDRLARQITGRSGKCAGPALDAWWAGSADTLAVIRFNQEQSINPDSRVSLAATRDALGLRTTVLDWRLTELDFHTMRAGVIAFGRYLAENDAGRARIRDWLLADPPRFPHVGEDEVAGWHHIGTTRMADDPRHGVVDRDCRVHGIANLFIGGSSVFPSGGYANPTYSIVQFALRLGDHLTSQVLVTH